MLNAEEKFLYLASVMPPRLLISTTATKHPQHDCESTRLVSATCAAFHSSTALITTTRT